MKTLSALISLLIAVSAVPAYVPGQPDKSHPREGSRSEVEDRGVIALTQTIRELANPLTVVSVAARPGDESPGTLAYCRNKLGARVVSVFATRNESADPLVKIGPADNIAAIRTRAALRAARIEGADLLFLGLPDPGAVRSVDVVFKTWDRELALSRTIEAIRQTRPDVLLIPANEGDGQQKAVRQLALEAVVAAADQDRQSPETGTWATRRVFEPAPTSRSDVLVNLTEFDYTRGSTPLQVARRALQQYASTGTRFEPDIVGYRLVRSSAADPLRPGGELTGGIVLPDKARRSVEPPAVGVLTLERAITRRDELVAALAEKLLEKRAEGSRDELFARYGVDFHRVIRFTELLERAIALSLGVSLEISLSDEVVNPGQKFKAVMRLSNPSSRSLPAVIHVPEVFPAPGGKPSFITTDRIDLAQKSVISREFEYSAAPGSRITVGSAARVDVDRYYPVASAPSGSNSGLGHTFLAVAEIGLDQVTIPVAAAANVDVAPPVEIDVSPPFAFVPAWDKSRDIDFNVRLVNHTPGPLECALWVLPLAVSDDKYEPERVSFLRKHEVVSLRLKLRVPMLKPPLSTDLLFELRRLPPGPEPLAQARIKLEIADQAVAEGRRIGLIRGYDWALRMALDELAVVHEEIDLDRVRGDLGGFDTIIVDARAYSADPDLKLINARLLDYVKQGGNLVVLYQSPGDWVFARQLSPYPLKLTTTGICDATVGVKILSAEHPLLSTPNKIADSDFDGWALERAVYVPGEWATDFSPLLECDEKDAPARGSLLVAEYGKGTYVYTSLALSRQLRLMKPGAFRLLANLVGQPRVR
ncbi:MAG TPA: PIG-L family deacetylase [Blastocatellia bacterium]|nr:PIG-L family deacetylase [Blastocatellia bacterium]